MLSEKGLNNEHQIPTRFSLRVPPNLGLETDILPRPGYVYSRYKTLTYIVLVHYLTIGNDYKIHAITQKDIDVLDAH